MLNNITIGGRLTRDPELRYTQSQKPVCTFTVACERDGGGEKKTDFLDCTAWNHTAEFVSKYFAKGGMILVNGRLQIREWEKDGERRRAPEIVANNVYFGGGKTMDYTTPDVSAADFEEPDFELPF